MTYTIELDPNSRYASQELIPWWSQEAVSRANVIVVGAGAIGNEVIKNLALLGVGHIKIYDLDHIEPGNLSRSVLFRMADEGRSKAEVACEAALQLNPHLDIRGEVRDIVFELGLGAVRDADIVLGCLDNRLARRALNEICVSVGTPWIDAAIDEMNGQVRLFGCGEGACYECILRDSDLQSIRARYSCPLLARERIIEGKVPTTVTSAALVAAWQCQEAMKHLCGQVVNWGSALISTGLLADSYSTTLPRKPDCPLHETPLPAPEAEASRHDAWKSIVDAIEADWISLRHGLITGFECISCGHQRDFIGTLGRVTEGDALCPKCNGMAQPRFISEITLDTLEILGHTPAECGIPDNENLQFQSGARQSVLRLL
jgi:adenylyltransferase/sulfurtransferase